jgi:flagellar hook protein FlgE
MNAAFSTALSGLNADSSAINVVGSDLANLNTTGYKSSEVEFSALMSQSLGATGSSGQVGLGVSTPIVVPQYTQGSIQSTGGPTDAAIQGNGFFVVQGQNNQTLYTRDGAFQINSAGQLVTATGQNVQGWSAVNGTINPNGAVGNISVPLGATIPATATTTMNMALNLNSQVATTAAGATVTAPISVIDSQGSSHTLTVTFNKTATNSWKYTVTIPATDLATGGSTTVATGTMTFDANGNLTSPTAANDPQVLKITGLADGASNMSINWNLYQNGSPTITQFAEASGVSGTTQNGYAAGQISNVNLQNGGLLVANYSNGQQLTVGQIAMASIANPDSLQEVGDNNLATTAQTATPAVGAAGTGSLGQIEAGALESSTVDIAQEFTNLLTFQRSYQADSRVITTSDELMQETVNLIHP